jgi:AAA family ATP:ADP antiporter
MLIIFFLISFNYNLLRVAKETMVVTAPQSGAEAIPFIKVWVMLPMAFLLTSIFSKLSNRFGREKVFYGMLSVFLGFFFIFTFFLYPLRNVLHPNIFAEKLQLFLPEGLSGFVSIIRNWSFTCFYAMSELWGALVLTVLFWGFANDVTSVKEAKRFYVLFGVGANIAGIFAGQAAILLSSNTYNPNIPFGTSAWEQTILYLNSTVIFIGLAVMLIYHYLNKKILADELPENVKKAKSATPFKMSLKGSFSYIAKSKYLICIALIVIGYNIAINLVEVVWKNQVKILYSNPSDYSIYMGHVTSIIGIIATITSIFISGTFLRKFSWSFNALLPPLIILVTAFCFFSFLILDSKTTGMIASFFGSTPLILSVLFGAIQNCVARASKFTLFDATKEISFIPLSQECKLKGKSAIDGVGSRIGKSGGSIIHQGLLLSFASLQNSAPYVAVIFFAIVGVWIFAARSLGRQFNQLTAQNEKIVIPESQMENVSN